jgi:hypothetical protein
MENKLERMEENIMKKREDSPIQGNVDAGLCEKKSEYTFALLDPRPIDAAKQSNDSIFSSNKKILGIEVTISALAKKCNLGNLDPQHSDRDISRAAIDVARDSEIPEKGTLLVTVRPDLDSIGSMALLSLREKGLELSEDIKKRIDLISQFDRSDRGEWTPKPLPTKTKMWTTNIGGPEISGLNVCVFDFKIPVNQRVKVLEQWIETGVVPQEHIEKAVKNRENLVTALESGQINIGTVVDGRIAKVTANNPAAVGLAYSLAPVAVVSNPEFRFQGGEPHTKHTVCQFKGGYVDLEGVLEELVKIEPGWGGSPTIIGSPQGVSSSIDEIKLVEIVTKHLNTK